MFEFNKNISALVSCSEFHAVICDKYNTSEFIVTCLFTTRLNLYLWRSCSEFFTFCQFSLPWPAPLYRFVPSWSLCTYCWGLLETNLVQQNLPWIWDALSWKRYVIKHPRIIYQCFPKAVVHILESCHPSILSSMSRSYSLSVLLTKRFNAFTII